MVLSPFAPSWVSSLQAPRETAQEDSHGDGGREAGCNRQGVAQGSLPKRGEKGSPNIILSHDCRRLVEILYNRI